MDLDLPRLYVILDVETARENDRSVLEVARDAFEAGARFFQCRFKERSDSETWRRVSGIADLLAESDARVVVNSRADMALAAHAAGVHLPGDGLPVPVVRDLVDGGLIGASTHSVTEAKHAERNGIDFATISPVFVSDAKPGYGPPLEVEGLREVCDAVDIPVYALAGIQPGRIRPCLDAGAHGVAVMSGICGADDVAVAVKSYLASLREE